MLRRIGAFADLSECPRCCGDRSSRCSRCAPLFCSDLGPERAAEGVRGLFHRAWCLDTIYSACVSLCSPEPLQMARRRRVHGAGISERVDPKRGVTRARAFADLCECPRRCGRRSFRCSRCAPLFCSDLGSERAAEGMRGLLHLAWCLDTVYSTCASVCSPEPLQLARRRRVHCAGISERLDPKRGVTRAWAFADLCECP